MRRRLRRLVALGVVAASVVPLAAQRPAVARPFFRLRLENAKVFRDSDYAPLFEGLGDLLAEQLGIEEAGRRKEVDRLWETLDWPVDVIAIYERRSETPLVGIRLPARTRPLLPSLVSLTSGDVAAATEVAYDEEPYRTTTVTLPREAGRLLVCEGVRGERRLLLLGAGSVGLDPAEAVGLFARSVERETPSRELLRKKARGGDVGWVFDYRSLLGSLSERRAVWAGRILGFVLGPRFTGLSGRMHVGEGKITIDLYADIVPGGGYVGTLIRREPRELSLSGWIPEDATDYVALDPSVDGCVRLLRNLGIFGGAQAVDFHDSLAWLSAVDLEDYLDTHFTGQVIAATEVGIETQFSDLENIKGFALGFGSFDGRRLLEETRKRVHGTVEPNGNRVELVATPEHGPGVYTLRRGREPFVHIAAMPDVVFVSGADPAGAAMLRKCLATAGRGEQLRAPGGVAPEKSGLVATMAGRGHVVRHLTAALEELDTGGPVAEGLPDVLRTFLAEHGGMATWRLVVDRDGARLHVEL